MSTPRRWLEFLRHDLWNVDLHAEPRWRRLGLGLLKIALHVVIRFSRSLASLQAAGLTLVTLLALVPMAALAFTIGRALGYGSQLDEQLAEFAKDLPRQLQDGVQRLRQLVMDTDFGALGLVGSLVVLWTGLVLFTRSEQALNHVFRTSHRRPWLRRVSDFVALCVLVPPMGLGALVLSSVLGGMRTIASLHERAAWLGWLYEAGLGFVPHAMLWVACTVLYRLMPSARVRWTAAAAGGVVAGSAVVLMHGVYVGFQVGVARANVLYATLAALPLLLVYLQMVWTIVLVGAEVTYAVQNLHALRGEEAPPPLTPSVRRRLCWHLVQRASAGFRRGERGVRPGQLAMDLDVPAEWLDAVAGELLRRGVLVQVLGDDDLLMPARPPEQLEPEDVLAAAEVMSGRYLERVRLEAAPEQALAAVEQSAGRALAPFRF